MRKKFCCEAARSHYETYYLDQSGSGFPIFVGARGQRGHGIRRSLLSGLFRSAFPMIKRGLASFGKHALKTGLEIANDVVEGESIKTSAKKRVPEGIKRFANIENFINQSGSGRRRFVRNRNKIKKRRRSIQEREICRRGRKRKFNDIFD